MGIGIPNPVKAVKGVVKATADLGTDAIKATTHLTGDVVHGAKDVTVKAVNAGLDRIDMAVHEIDLDVMHVPDVFGAVNTVKDKASGAFHHVVDPFRDYYHILRHDGTKANRKITKAYDTFDQSFQAYLGEPAQPNWTTYGKHASKQAGLYINRLEDLLSLDPISLVKRLFDEKGQLGDLLGEFGKPLLEDIAKDNPGMFAAGALGPVGLAAGGVQLGLALRSRLKTLYDGLVAANKGIYKDFQPAFDTFLAAESSGRDGVAAVKEQIAAGKIKDPSGLLTEALLNYKEARALGQNPTPENLARRQQLIAQANLLIGLHEQYHVVEPIFADKEFSRLSGVVSGALTIQDANGEFELLQNGQGNWADFATRMGLEELGAAEGEAAFAGHRNGEPGGQIFKLVDKQGQAHYYRVAPAEKLPGTIIDYFNQRGGGEAAANNARAL